MACKLRSVALTEVYLTYISCFVSRQLLDLFIVERT